MTHTRRFILTTLLFAVVVAPASAQSDPSAAGAWRVNFIVQTGSRFVNMIINQKDTTLTGTVFNEDGEFPLKGRIEGDQVTILWTVAENGELMDITVKGKLAGDVITGTAQLGNVGEGALTARREAE